MAPLVPLEVYQKTLSAIEARKGRSQAGRLPRVPLTGRHVRCGTCGGPMYCRQQRVGVLYFGCYRQSHGTCVRGVAVKASWLIPAMERRLLERVSDARATQRRPRSADPVTPLAEEVRRIESALGHLTSLYVDGGLLDGEYR